jgi:tryptophan 2,3-dioxygenase
MIDLDEGVLLWRQRPVAMVERMIGNRRGTGGSSGVSYLSKTLTKRFFPEIWDARNYIGDSEYGRK